MRGKLLPSVKVARTKSYWPSTPKKAARHRHEVPLPGDLAAAEDRVALGIDGLDELGVDPVAARREFGAAQDVGGLPEDEIVVVGVIDLAVETERAVEPLEAELGAVGGLDLQVLGSPMSKVPDASWAPCANSSSAVGARWMRDTAALATIHDGRSLTTLKLMLLGVKPTDCSDSNGSSGGGTKVGGKMPEVPSRRTVSMRPASSVRSVSVSHSSL
jgi:hypothetical protein